MPPPSGGPMCLLRMQTGPNKRVRKTPKSKGPQPSETTARFLCASGGAESDDYGQSS
jgi:hypothetical protein